MHDIVFDQIDHKSAWLVLGVIVNCHVRIVLIPAPVFLPRQCIPEQAAVCDGCKMRMQLMKIGIVPVHTPYIPGCFYFRRNLPILDIERNFIGYDLPAQMMIQRYGIWIQEGKRSSLLFHMFQTLIHQFFHNALPGIFRICTNTRNKSNGKYLPVYIHFQWIYGKLGNQGIPIKTSQHIRTLQYRELRLFDLFIFPSGCRQFILRYLKGIAQQRVVLIQILHILWF